MVQDIMFVIACYLAILIAENNHFDNHDPDYNVFKLTFEVVSAYGPIGLSLGSSMYCRITKAHRVPGGRFESFSVRFTKFSKVMVMILMLMGRHRRLPIHFDNVLHYIQNTEKAVSTKQNGLDDIPRLDDSDDIEIPISTIN